ncbi:hypothetical protein H310_01884 [Aphanomyces invadans]|uniref:Transmembrane protein n=1 Tax=Aphanomyces invadans TaxID=157072 RepID=A0A024UNZ9_9STRA|nr:hypothetical protein H310_01884 [Aphanomyces invadans]ETW07348.1 hypothetical protein H310_01884 [Aphanomyces invadans]|eukprot:XP_008863441.1 hypothetical protein H310_01884 [Aphanomyces invadans]
MATRRRFGGAFDSSQQSTSGWVDGEVDVHEDVSSILQDERLKAWDASAAFPRKIRYITCALLFFVGSASFMYKRILLRETQEYTILAQIRQAIVEMDEIAATAAAMEGHVHRLAALTQPHLDLQAADTNDAKRPDVLRAEVDAIHADTMRHMESMLQAVVETTRQDVLDLAASWAVQPPPTPSPLHAVDLDTNVDQGAADVDTSSDVPTTSQVKSRVEPLPPLPPRQVHHVMANDTTSTPTSQPIQKPPKANPMHFVLFTMIGTLVITAVLVYWMQTRGSFHESRVAFQNGTTRLQRLAASCQACCVHLLETCHNALAAWSRLPTNGWIQLFRAWWRQDSNVNVEEVSDDDEVSFYPQTPVTSARQKDRALYDDAQLPRKHISFADIESDDEVDDADDASFAPSRRPSNFVRTDLYENILTPEPAPTRGFHVRRRGVAE